MPLDSAYAHVELRPDLPVRGSGSSETRNLQFLKGELICRVDGALAHSLSRRAELVRRPIGERIETHRSELVVRHAKVNPRIDSPMRAAEPLAVDQMGPRSLRSNGAPIEALDRLEIKRLGVDTGGE